jgi:hypothetical protein
MLRLVESCFLAMEATFISHFGIDVPGWVESVKWLIIGYIIAFGTLDYALKAWHRRLMLYLYREHRTTCEKLDAKLFERHKCLPDWTSWGGWSWAGLRFFLFKKYEVLDDPDLLSRARRFRLALGISLLTFIVVGAAALYWDPH